MFGFGLISGSGSLPPILPRSARSVSHPGHIGKGRRLVREDRAIAEAPPAGYLPCVTEVVVALIGDPNTRSDILPREELNRPYSERKTALLQVDDQVLVSQILREAASRLDLHGWAAEPRWIGFYRPEDAEEVPPDFFLMLPTVDDRGRARWVPPPHDVPLADVLRAADQGFLYGDPHRMHIALVPPVGDGVLPDWPTIGHALELLKTVAEYLSIPGGVAATAAVLKGRLKIRGPVAASTVERRSPTWHRQGADPYAFEEWLARGAWRPEQICQHLECSVEEAEAVLWAFGFAACEDGRWRREVDEEAQLLADNMRMMVRMSINEADDAQLIEEFSSRAQELVDTGKAPPIDWQTLDWLRPTPSDS